MDLLDYPRPINDTGIGVHWSAGISHVSLAQLRSFWIPELQALGVCWVKIADHRYALSLAEELLAAGIMPIVQIQRQGSRTLAFSSAEIEAVDELVAAGVRYFEPQYVAGSLRVPPLREAIHVVADRVVADLESVLARGGLPALPPLAPQHHFDLLRLLIERGHLDLIRGPIWQSLRNGGLNRPLNFPHDPGHRDGAPLTQEYYDVLAHEDWSSVNLPGENRQVDAWQGNELPWINDLRRRAAQNTLPDTVKIPAEDECWLAYEAIDAINQRLLGRSLPILSTAGGWVIGAKADPRYPVMTPLLHLAQTLEACRVMMGTSRRYAPAPDAFFCTAFWLLANEAVESDRAVPEEEAWYSAIWPQQTLPIVPALKGEPKRTRLPFWTPSRQTAQPLQSADTPIRIDAPARSQTEAASSTLSGHVRGGAGATLCLVRADGVLYRTLAANDGHFEFVDLARGRYTIWVEQPVGSRRENIELDGRNQVELKLTVDRWGHEAIPLEEAGPSLLRCRVESSLLTTEAGTLAIRVRRSDDATGQSSRVVPLARRADGISGCEITPLSSGEYRVEVLGVTTGDGDPFQLEALVRIGGPTMINFVFNRPFERGFLQFSEIYGQVAGGWRQQLVLTDAQGRQRTTAVDEQDRYAFDHLSPGLYTVALVGQELTTARNRIGIDGKTRCR
ncbi:MAG: carboxypeptidase-like regulatory domain-containing protein [Caldilineaceae bacterium]